MTRSHHSRRGARPPGKNTFHGSKQGRCIAHPIVDDDYDFARELDALGKAWKIHDDNDETEEEQEVAETEEEQEVAEQVGHLMPLAELAGRVDALGAMAVQLRRQLSGCSDGESWVCDDSTCSAAEWSLVSAGESEWSTVFDAIATTSVDAPAQAMSHMDVPAPATTPWGDDDAALARALQEEEWGLLARRTSQSKSRRSVGARTSRGALSQSVAFVAKSTLAQLRECCGLCVVCRDSLALVVWEPCGHLALCEACLEQMPKVDGRSCCVVCRTEGVPLRLIRPAEDAHGEWSQLRGLSLSAESGKLEHLVPRHSWTVAADQLREERRLTKLEYRRAKRALSRVAKVGKVAIRDKGWEERHPWIEDGWQHLQRQRQEEWDRQYPQVALERQLHEARRAAWCNTRCYGASKRDARPVRASWINQRYLPWYPPPLPRASHAAHVMQAVREETLAKATHVVRLVDSVLDGKRCAQSLSKSMLRCARAEEQARVAEARREAAGEAERTRSLLAKTVAEVQTRSQSLGGVCRVCEKRRACMLVVCCGHVTLCRECWEADGRAIAPGLEAVDEEDEAAAPSVQNAGKEPIEKMVSTRMNEPRRRCLECGRSSMLALELFRPLD